MSPLREQSRLGRVRTVRAAALHDASLYRTFTRAVAALQQPLEGRRVLDIGCGSHAPMSLMLHSSGVVVTGIDTRIGYRWGLGLKPSRYRSYWKEVGLLRTLRRAAGEILFDRHYYTSLATAVGYPLTENGLELREMSAEALEFSDDSFDVVYSNATWEHLVDVSAANREVARVLRPGGLAYIEIHLFPSLSGAHDLPWIVPGSTDLGRVVLPWRHLRDSSWKPPVYLNRLRERQYRERFERTPALEILSWQTEFTEGGDLLTDDILHELPDYTREELTKRSVIVVVRKHGSRRSC